MAHAFLFFALDGNEYAASGPMSLSLENEPPAPIWEYLCWTWRPILVVVQEQKPSYRESIPDIQVAACISD